jgi:hypothetical protein
MTLYCPLIAQAGWGRYAPTEQVPVPFTVTPTAGAEVGIAFTAADPADLDVFLIGDAQVYFVAKGTTITLSFGQFTGPTVTAPADRDLAALWIDPAKLTACDSIGQPKPEWWTFEVDPDPGVTVLSLIQGFVAADAAAKGLTEADLQAKFGAGLAPIWVKPATGPLAIGKLALQVGPVSTRIRAYGVFGGAATQLDALSALLSLATVEPTLAPPAGATDSPHPVLRDAKAVAATSPVTLHARFVFFEPTSSTGNATSLPGKGDFNAVPVGSTIALQKRSGTTYTTLASAAVASNGQVALTVARADLASQAATDVMLLRLTLPANTTVVPQYQHKNEPREAPQAFETDGVSHQWLTEGIGSRDGALPDLNLLRTLAGTAVGSAASPIEFSAGFHLFLKLCFPVVYTSGSDPNAQFKVKSTLLPKGVMVWIKDGTTELARFRTDEHGMIFGTVTRWRSPLAHFDLYVVYDIVDPSVRLQRLAGGTLATSGTVTDAMSIEHIDVAVMARGTRDIPRVLDVVEVTTAAYPPSSFNAPLGHSAGVLFAFQQIRYVHQWWHALTDDAGEAPANRIVDKSFATLLEELATPTSTEFQYQGKKYKRGLPVVVVAEPVANRGDIYGAALRDPYKVGSDDFYRWALTLYGKNSFRMGETLTKSTPAGGTTTFVPRVPDRVQFWRPHTIWHEYSHVVVNIALGLLDDLAADDRFIAVKSAFPAEIDRIAANGWDVLSEGIPYLVQNALEGSISGSTPVLVDPAKTPTFIKVLDTGGAVIQLDAGATTPLADKRLGLRVTQPFVFGLWAALTRIGALQDLQSVFSGPPKGNELATTATFLSTQAANHAFRRLVWGPLRMIRVPTVPPQSWTDIGGTPTAPITIQAPTTFDFLRLFKTSFYPGLTAADQAIVRDLFGDVSAPDPIDNSPNPEQVSYYLWFDW